jgi:hypothetical protein
LYQIFSVAHQGYFFGHLNAKKHPKKILASKGTKTQEFFWMKNQCQPWIINFWMKKLNMNENKNKIG